MRSNATRCTTLVAAGIAQFFLTCLAIAGEPVDFNRDIRPILSDACFQCHGPDQDKRKAGLRLDTRDGLYRVNDGVPNLVPGKPDESEVFSRIGSDDDEIRMPPPSFGRRLGPQQISLIKRWIEQGAEWKGHWAYLTPMRPAIPKVKDQAFTRNEIDRFILAQIEAAGLSPSPEADRATLIRRLSFDLTGLPPTPAEIDAFVNDSQADAYEKLVDRLLESPRYGERMALFWLDLVRFADTTGYHGDNHVDLWLFRDYVIRAFNENKPFNVFTVEQLAGDLVPSPTDETRIASGYNRLLQTTQEGGAQAKEYLAKYSSDRVRNASTVWLGATMGCAECHDHKYDPFTTRDFYQFAAFFADLKETAVGVQEPTRFPSPDQADSLRRLDEKRGRLLAELNQTTPELEADQRAWENSTRQGKPPGSAAVAPPKAITDILAIETVHRSPDQKKLVSEYYRNIAPRLDPIRKAVNELQKQRDAIVSTIPTSLVSVSVPPRTIRVLPRGNWLDESGAAVAPDVPASLPPLGVKERNPNRLDLARWMVSDRNPLVARVFVNRLWNLAFGQGLVTTLDDFGAQGAWPSHPELLDWLARDFIEKGWNIKELVRLLVTSGTYRQASLPRELDQKIDPTNRWLSRQNRFRLDAEMVRDNALAVSGLLSDRLGGPSVKPYQPAGYWVFLNFPQRDYVADKGANQYRRGLYTYWQRTFLHPSLLAFDASTREECVVQRPRSNTPLQALVLLNDPTYVEAARALAARVLTTAEADPSARLQQAYRLVLGRPPRPKEALILLELLRRHEDQYKADPASAQSLLQVGNTPLPNQVDPTELAAWTSVARALLNLHETITRN